MELLLYSCFVIVTLFALVVNNRDVKWWEYMVILIWAIFWPISGGLIIGELIKQWRESI